MRDDEARDRADRAFVVDPSRAPQYAMGREWVVAKAEESETLLKLNKAEERVRELERALEQSERKWSTHHHALHGTHDQLLRSVNDVVLEFEKILRRFGS